jgi:glyoxylase-like metal-dependent hydrolase (beta-lactamase superfamily II)
MKLNSAFEARHGEPVQAAPNVMRITAANAGPFTFAGTNTYLVGEEDLAIIDPGPDLPAHFDALRAAISGRKVSGIFVTHTHRDHTELLLRLRSAPYVPAPARHGIETTRRERRS